MILRPVRPQSPCGPPVTKRPVGLTWMMVLSSKSCAGSVGSITFAITVSRISSWETSGECCVETTTVWTRSGCMPSYSTVTWLLPSGRSQSTPSRRTAASRLVETVRQHDRQRHQLRGLVAGEAEHHALIAGAADVDAHRDVARLLADRDQHRRGVAVEAEAGVGVADLAQRRAHQARKVDLGAWW